MAKNEKPANYDEAIVAHDDDLHHQEQRQRTEQEQQQHDKTTQGVCLILLSAFLFSFMGMFLQFTGHMGLPSTELVFIRSVFQGSFVLLGMITFRLDDSSNNNSPRSTKNVVGSRDVETGNGSSNNLDVEEVGMVPIHDDLAAEEKKLEEEMAWDTSPKRADEEASLMARAPKRTYGMLPTIAREDSLGSSPNSSPPLIIRRPFGTTPTMRKVVILRGIIGGFGFINNYYTLSTLPLGDATTLLSLYPIVTIFLARIVLGEEIKPLNILAALLSIVGAALISQPSFLFGSEDENDDRHRPPKLGYVTALTGSICASGVIVLIRKAGKVGAHTLQLLFSWTVFGVSFSLLVGFIAASAESNQRWRMPSLQEIPSVLGVCISGTFAHFLLNYAVKLVPATLSGLLRSSDIFWAYLLEMIVLSEHPAKTTWCGVVLVCSSLAMILLASNEKTSNTIKRLGSFGSLSAVRDGRPQTS